MNVVILFINVGFYHAARLQGAKFACEKQGWNLSAVQLTHDTLEHPWGKADQALGVPLLTLVPKNGKRSKFSRRQGLPLVSRTSVYKHLCRLNPDVLFLPGWSFAVCKQMLDWAVRHRVPAVVMSESKCDDMPRSWWKERLKAWFYLSKFDGALVGGDAHAAYIAGLGVPVNRIFKGYDIIDNSHFAKAADEARAHESETRSRYSNMPPRPYFMAAFRLVPRKNGAVLLEAYNAYRRILGVESWDLVICGSGEQHSELLKTIQETQLLSNVHLVGFLSYDEIGHWYGLAEAFIHPALQEQWGLVVNEACAAGLPILCSKFVGAVPDLVHEGVNGFLFNPTNVEEITDSMVRIHQVGERERKRLGEQSRRLVEACTPEVFGLSVVAATKMATGHE